MLVNSTGFVVNVNKVVNVLNMSYKFYTTKSLHIKTSHIIYLILQITINNCTIPYDDKVRYIRIVIDPHLYSSHI